MWKSGLIVVTLFLMQRCPGQSDYSRHPYQKLSGDTAEAFLNSVISQPGFFVSERIAITPDGKEIYYTERNGYAPGSAAKIKCLKYYHNTWNRPFDVFDDTSGQFHGAYITSPGLSPNGKVLYFHDDKHQSYYAVRTDTGWSKPSIFWNNNLFKHYLQLTEKEHYYVISDPRGGMSNLGLCEIQIHTPDTTINDVKLPLDSEKDVIDFYISRDESYLIFSAQPKQKRTCYGYVDLFISYKKSDGTWTNPKNLGPAINAPRLANWGPYVTADNGYLFFSRGINEATTHLYSIRFGNVIDSLKHTNFIPYVNRKMHDQSVRVGSSFTFRIDDSVFVDDDGNNTLGVSASQENGDALPRWLTFNPNQRTFSGIPVATGKFAIRVTATDRENATISSEFNFMVVPAY